MDLSVARRAGRLPLGRGAALVAAVAAAGIGLAPAATASATGSGDTTPPAFTHVWQIQLENEEATTTFQPCPGGPASPPAGMVDPYINCTMAPSGVYLSNYYATGHNSLDNYLSQEAGIPGNPDTFADCQEYQDFVGSAATTGALAAGAGCVYPTSIQTLEDQLASDGKTWQGLNEDMGWNPQRETATCGQPATAGVADNPSATVPSEDDTQTATQGDQYAARHNPFAYFHSLLDSGSCAKNVVPLGSGPTNLLGGLTASLANPADFTWITPDLCDDGHDSPCKGPDLEQEMTDPAAQTDGSVGVGGLTSADRFLSIVVPRIEASPAYKSGGLILLTFDEGTIASDDSSCCGEVAGTTGVQPQGGGGRTGALLISPLLTPGTSAVAYNHYSLLRSLEDIYGVDNDGQANGGYLEEAATANAFGPDVYDLSPNPALPEVADPALYAVPVVALGGIAVAVRRRRRSRRHATRA